MRNIKDVILRLSECHNRLPHPRRAAGRRADGRVFHGPDPHPAAGGVPSRVCAGPKIAPSGLVRRPLRRRRTLIVLPHLDTPPARTLSQSSVQENPGAQECTAPGFLDSGLTVFASTRPRPARRGRVARSGRPGSLLTLAPHRSGRAGSAASGSSTDSFATRRRVPAGPGSQAMATAIPKACLASSAIRCRDVETGPNLGVLAVFPSTGATCRCPLPSTGSRGLNSPASAVL